MTLAIVLVCLGLYLGLAVAVGRFCGINSAWDHVVEGAMREESRVERESTDRGESQGREDAERILDEAVTRSDEQESVEQPV